MPIRLTDLKKQQRTIPVLFFDEKGEVTYNIGAITDQMFDDVRNASEAEDENSLNAILARIALDWDVLDEKGKPIPIVDDGAPAPELASIPIPFKSAVLTQIMEDVQGNPTRRKKTSGAGSFRKGK